MRKYLWIGIGVFMIGCVGGSWLYFKDSTARITNPTPANNGGRTARQANNDGDAEASDVIEPLIVERAVIAARPAIEEGPATRVQWTTGIEQPPRPDAEPGKTVRMPYADENPMVFVPFDPIQWILESPLPRLNFDEEEKPDPVEQAEPMEVLPPLMNMPHHSHCPHSGGCPAPFPYRAGSRY